MRCRQSAGIALFVLVAWTAWAAIAQAAAPVAGVFSIDGVRLRSFPLIAAGSSVAFGDVDADGDREIVVGSPQGVKPQVSVYDLDGTRVSRFAPYGPGMRAGLNVAVGDVEGDGNKRIVVAPRRGAGPQVFVYDYLGNKIHTWFWAYGKGFRGGVSLATADLNDDGRDEIITGAGPGGAGHLSVLQSDGVRLKNVFPYPPSFRSGLALGTVDLNADLVDEAILGPLEKGVADIMIVEPMTGAVRASFRALGKFKGGVSLASLRAASSVRIIVGAGPGGGPDVEQYDPATGLPATKHFFAFDRSWRGGVTVGMIDIDEDGQEDIFAVPGSPTMTQQQLSQYERSYAEPVIDGASYSLERITASSGFFDVGIIRADLDNPNIVVKTVTATSEDCTDDCPVHPLQYYVDQAKGFAGLNGGYFCPTSDASCAAKDGTYNWLWYNSLTSTFVNLLQNQYYADPVIAFGGQNVPYLYPVSRDFHTKEEFELTNGVPLTALLSNTPLLVQNEKSVVRSSRLDSQQRTIKTTRVGIGLKGRTLVMFAARRATVLDLAHVGVALGLDLALNLDGGASTALTFNSRYKSGPGRNIPTAIVLSTR